MTRRKLARWLYLPLVLACLPSAAQQARHPANLDVPYAPTDQATVEVMLRLAAVGPGDYLIDLGSGDGRIPITAAKRYGARGLGVDLDPQRIEESLANAKAAGVTDRVRFERRNLFDTKIADATVVTLYLLQSINLKLRPRLLAEMKPGARVVSHHFDMDDWKPDLRAAVRGARREVYVWTVPARVGGGWKLRSGSAQGDVDFELHITQFYQEIDVAASRAGKGVVVVSPSLEGDAISFTLLDNDAPVYRKRFAGRVAGATMSGTLRGDGEPGEYQWRATR